MIHKKGFRSVFVVKGERKDDRIGAERNDFDFFRECLKELRKQGFHRKLTCSKSRREELKNE